MLQHSSAPVSRVLAAALTAGLVSVSALVLTAAPAAAATPLSGVEVTAVPATASTVATTNGNPCGAVGVCGAPTTLTYGSSTDLRLDGFSAGGLDYRVVAGTGAESYTEIYRVDNANVQGLRDLIFIGRDTPSTPYGTLRSSDPGTQTMGDVLGNSFVTQGSDNTFANADTVNVNNVERISFMRTEPIVTPDADLAGLTVLERGGNDAFKLAAVTAVDGSGTPIAWGPLVSVPATSWGTVVDNVPSTVLTRGPGDTQYRPTDVTGQQRLAGVYVTFAELGMSGNQPVFGVSMIPNDATAPAQTSPVLTTDGTTNGGIDLIGGVFASAVNPEADPATSTGPQGRVQTLPLAYRAGDTLTDIDRTATVLEAPAGGAVSDGGLTVTVPGEGVYTLDRATDIVTFTPEPGFVGEATALTYRVVDALGGEATSTITPTVTPVAAPDTSTGPQGVPQQGGVLDNDGTDDVVLVPASLRLLDADGAEVSALTLPGVGSFTVVDDDVQFQPQPDFVGVAPPITYRVDDTEGNAVESTYTPTVVGTTPQLATDATTGPQGVPQTVDPLDNDAPGDPAVPLDPDSLTLLDADGDPVPTVTVPEGTYTLADGVITFTPDPAFVGTATPVNYRVADANGTTATSTYTPQLVGVVPIARGDVTEDVQGQQQRVDPLDNDDPGVPAVPLDRTSLTLLDADGDPTGTLTIAGQGTYSVEEDELVFTPLPDFTGVADPAPYRIADVNGTTAVSTYTAEVVPGLSPDTSSGLQGRPHTVDVLANDGTDGLVIVPGTLQLVDPATGEEADEVTIDGEGTWAVVDGEVAFVPEPQFTGTATTILYRVQDDDGDVLQTALVISVDPVTPTAEPDTSSGPQGVAQSTDPLSNDEPGADVIPLVPGSLTLLDGDGAPAGSVTVDGQGTYTVVDGLVVFTPEPQFVGTADAVTYRVADVNGTTAVSTYTPTLIGVTPTAGPDTSSGPQGDPQSVDPLLNDVPGDDAVPLDPGSLTLLDGDGEPVGSVTVDGEGTYTISDDDQIVFTPVDSFSGVATPVTYQVADVNGTTVTGTYTPTVTPVTPTAEPDSSTGLQGLPQSVDPLGNDDPGAVNVPLDPTSLTLLDADGDPTIAVTVDGEGTYTISEGRIVFTPLPAFTGTATPADYRVADANGTTATSTYTPSVTPVAPSASVDTSTGRQGAPQSVDPLVNDLPGAQDVPLVPGSLTLLDEDDDPVASVSVPGEGTYEITDGKIVFTPEPAFTGTATPVTYQVADANGTTATSTYTPTVVAVQPGPVPDTSTGRQGTPQSVDPLDNDTPGDPDVPLDPSSLTLLDGDGGATDVVTVPGEGTYEILDGQIVFTPEPGFTGGATPVSYRVADDNGTTATSTYTPTVVAVTPIAQDDVSTGGAGEPQSVDPLANDAPGDGIPLDPASLTLLGVDGDPVDSVAVEGEGTYALVDGRIVFTPEPGFTGVATPVTYRVADDNGTTTTATYTPTVTDLPQRFVEDLVERADAGQAVTFDLADEVPDLRPDSVRLVGPAGELTTTLVVLREGVWTVDTQTGAVTFTPEAGFTGDPSPVDWVGTTTDDEPVTGSLTVLYDQAPPPPTVPPGIPQLPVTGAAAVGLLGAAVLLLGLGVVLVVGTRGRRRTAGQG